MNCAKSRGFTLIEMLLVVSLLGITGIAVYHAISDGLRVWQYSRRFSAEEDVAIFLEKLAADLQNTQQFSLIRFHGKEDKIVIPAIVRVPADKKDKARQGQYLEQLGAVEYSLQKDKRAVRRRQANYSLALKKRFFEYSVVAAPVERLQFSYYLNDPQRPKPQKVCKDEIPLSVEVSIDFVEVNGGIRNIRRLINIPVAARL